MESIYAHKRYNKTNIVHNVNIHHAINGAIHQNMQHTIATIAKIGQNVNIVTANKIKYIQMTLMQSQMLFRIFFGFILFDFLF